MIPTVRFDSGPGKKSTGLAVLFALIAVMGMLMIFTSSQDKVPPESPTLIVEKSADQHTDFQSKYSGYMVKIISVTGGIILLFVFGAKWYRKHQAQSSSVFHMNVLGKQYFSPKQYLMLVRIEEKKMLLGITDQSINLLKEYEDDEEAGKDGYVGAKTVEDPINSFSKILSRISSRNKA
ncbi:flagellar biosynthetic protein FliO [Caldithrix abyssi]|nr:flagellar biosynthetic protein FliO [Caldithrix abyssi]